MIYDVTNKSSFESLGHWMSEIEKLAPSGTPRIVIGNKSDLETKRVISTKEGREAAMKFKAQDRKSVG